MGIPVAAGVRLRWKRLTRGTLAFAFLAGGVGAAGCEGDAGRGALIGGGLGLAGGTLIGHQSGHAGEGALIGAQRDLRRERERGRYAYEEGYGRGYDEGYHEAYRPPRRHGGYRYDDDCD